MNQNLEKLKLCKNRADLAQLLELDIAFLNRTLFQIPIKSRYQIIEIPKKNSKSKRKIFIPDGYLKVLQTHLAHLLTEIFEFLKKDKPIISFAYRKDNESDKYGIYQNACKHINKKIVLNLDIKNYFETINFQRIVGFFMKNKNFILEKEVAITIAQIACYSENGKTFLPQGSPCSPVISNFIGEIIDSKITKLKSKYKFSYTRYADDLTLSFTHIKVSENIFNIQDGIPIIGKSLEEAIQSSGFEINKKKTRLHFRNNRQSVTGLTVNSKVNINKYYYKNTKSMGLAYCMYNDFYKSKNHVYDENIPNVNSLIGIFNYVNHIKKLEKYRQTDSKPKISIKNNERTLEPNEYLFEMNSFERLFLKVLFHRSFIYHKKINILCEGKTDPLHLNNYLEKTTNYNKNNYNFFAFKESAPSFFSKTLHIQSGTGSLIRFIQVYESLYHSKKKMMLPTIILVDNDKAGESVFNAAKKRYPITYSEIKDKVKYAFICMNLYIIQIPSQCLLENKDILCIEDMYHSDILNIKFGQKELYKGNNPKEFKNDKHYTKDTFINEVVCKTGSIDYRNFDCLIEIINVIHNLNLYKNISSFKLGKK